MQYLFIFLSVFLGFTGKAQDIQTSLVKTYPLEADVFYGVDVFENIYFGKNNVLYKKTSDITYQFNNLSLGSISSISINNPLEIMVFYKDFNTVIILDNTLNIIQKLSFLDKNISLVAKADKNKLWLYNTDRQQLELYNYKTKTVLAKSQPQSLLNPKEIKGNANFAWVKTNSNTINIYNNYGSFVYSLDKKVDRFAVTGASTLIFEENTGLYLFDNSLHKINFIKPVALNNLSVVNDNIYIYDANKIFMFVILKN
ncbi:MAG: hypothetical protein L3J45_08155 [Flavobacteriaceae bacterium]|nr:hypothetical protein [Flavobacteriaceae bacterium]